MGETEGAREHRGWSGRGRGRKRCWRQRELRERVECMQGFDFVELGVALLLPCAAPELLRVLECCCWSVTGELLRPTSQVRTSPTAQIDLLIARSVRQQIALNDSKLTPADGDLRLRQRLAPPASCGPRASRARASRLPL